MDLRELIRKEIARRGISQAAFGRRVGASAGLVSRWLSDEVPTQPGYEYCLRIAGELGLPETDVLEMAGHRRIDVGTRHRVQRRDLEKEMVLRELEAILDQTPRNHWPVLARVTRATSEALPEASEKERDPEEYAGNDDGRYNSHSETLMYDNLSPVIANTHSHTILAPLLAGR